MKRRRVVLSLFTVAALATVYVGHAVRETAACEDPNGLLARGHACYEANDLEGAMSKYREAIRLDGACQEAYESLSQCYRDTGRYAESVDMWQQAKASLPEWRWPHVQLAFDYNDLGMYEQAIVEWKQLIELEPDVAGLHALLADVYLKTGQYEKAAAVCTRALQLQPDNKKAHANLCRACVHLGNEDLAWTEYEALKALDEAMAKELLLCVGHIYDESGGTR
jgi:tetratricopeptide (TPR) repeat protein